MGRDWYKAGRSSKRTAGSRGGARREASITSSSSSGCMSAVLHFFDFHPQVPSFKPSSPSPQDHNNRIPKDIEAPRKSFASSPDGIDKSSSVTNEVSNLKNLKFPNGIQIKTSTSGFVDDDMSSPGAKTPTLVARLMGLDLLPDAHSPRSSSSLSTPNSQGKAHIRTKPSKYTDCTDITSSLSLPVTPRISTARKSDVDHHRLSLQIIKENVDVNEGLEQSRISYSRWKLEDRSPSHYARQIVKQVKESVSRKVGLDITNTVKNQEQRRDEFLNTQVKSKKKESTKLLDEHWNTEKHSTSSCSPRLRFIDTKSKVRTTGDQNSQPQSIGILRLPKSQTSHEKQRQYQKPIQVTQCKKAASDGKFSSKLKRSPKKSDIIQNKHAESFVIPMSNTRTNIPDIKNKFKKSNRLLSSNLLNLPTPLPAKKDPSPPATKIPQKPVSDTKESNENSSQLSSCSVQAYKQEMLHKAAVIVRESENYDEDRLNGASIISGDVGSSEFQYICDILNRTGIHRGTKVSFNGLFSPSHPLDPSVFHFLEECPTSSDKVVRRKQHGVNACTDSLELRCNRKLLFDVVDEILVEILNPCANIKPCIINWMTIPTHCGDQNQMEGSELIETLYKKIRSFPMSDCQFLEHIDALVEGDLRKLKLQEEVMILEQAEGLASEIEGNILDTLVREAVMGCISISSLSPYNRAVPFSFNFRLRQ